MALMKREDDFATAYLPYGTCQSLASQVRSSSHADTMHSRSNYKVKVAH